MSAVFYDGTSNRKHRVELRPGEGLHIVEDGAVLDTWAYDHIRQADGDMALRLTSISAPALARLDIEDAATAERLKAYLPPIQELREKPQTGRIVGWSLAAAGSIALMVLYGVPLAADKLAPFVPASFEKRLGEAVDGQVRALIGGETCSGAEGQKAFSKLIAALNNAGGDTQIEAAVLKSDIPNAVTLPGGKIYLFDGLLQKANNPDEVAGVIAHEIGHAHNRDNLRTLITTGGTSFLFGLLFGDITGSSAVIFVSRSLLDASHSREAEAGADDFAAAAMTGLGRPATAMGEFLVRVTGAGRTTILDSHPASAERLERIRQYGSVRHGAAILSDGEWQALKDICRKTD